MVSTHSQRFTYTIVTEAAKMNARLCVMFAGRTIKGLYDASAGDTPNVLHSKGDGKKCFYVYGVPRDSVEKFVDDLEYGLGPSAQYHLTTRNLHYQNARVDVHYAERVDGSEFQDWWMDTFMTAQIIKKHKGWVLGGERPLAATAPQLMAYHAQLKKCGFADLA